MKPNLKAGSACNKERKPMKAKGSIMSSLQRLMALLDVLNTRDQSCQGGSLFIKGEKRNRNHKGKEQEEKSITELLAEERFQKANQALNESQSPQEMRILDLEIQKQQCLEEMKEWMNDLGRKDNIKGGDSNRLYKKCEDNL
ncbi:hypothetical protein Tco_0684844 [Tanacetum coccineum]